jgi:hypothetical protein
MATHSAQATKPAARERGEELSAANLGNVLRFDVHMARMMARPFEMWLRYQADMLRAVEPATLGWLQRQRESADAGLQMLTRLAACSDVQETAAIQREWLDGMVKRFSADFRAVAEQAVALSQEAVSATHHAAQTATETGTPVFQAADQKERPIERAA